MNVTIGQVSEYLEGIGLVTETLVKDPDVEISSVRDYRDAFGCSASWCKGEPPRDYAGCLLLVGPGYDLEQHAYSLLVSTRPRLALIRMIRKYFQWQIGQGSVTYLRGARVHPSAVVGAIGQGYEWDDGHYTSMPHLAGVEVGEDVDIGPCATVMRGVLRDTVIGDGCKIGNGVNVGHGARLGSHCLISAQATIGGSAELGDRVTVWQSASIAHGVRIGDRATIAMGAAVLKDVPAGETWVGNPARNIERRL